MEGEYLEYFIVGGSDMKDVLENYIKLIGRLSFLFVWFFGLWFIILFIINYDEKIVISFIDGMIERDILFYVFYFDCFWMKDMYWVDFEWDKRVFLDLKNMFERLKEKGVKICVWINFYVF